MSGHRIAILRAHARRYARGASRSAEAAGRDADWSACLALGTGANSAIFSCLDGIYLRPLGAPDSSSLMRIFAATDQEAYGLLTYPEYRAILSQSQTLSGVAVGMYRSATWVRGDQRQRLSVYGVSPDFFQVMGVQPRTGRVFSAADDRQLVAVLGWNAWQRWFGGNPAIAGKSMAIARGTRGPQSITIVGVLPPEFRDTYPSGDRDLWIPSATFAALNGSWSEFEDRRDDMFLGFARLKPGMTQQQAQAELSTIDRRLADAYPDINSKRRFIAISDLGWRLHSAGATGVVLLLIVLGVVSIACVNVANLLLANGQGRRRELAVRMALGASRWRLTRQLLMETVSIGVAGLLLGLLLAQWIIAGLPALIGLSQAESASMVFRLDLRVVSFTAILALVTALFAGLYPAWSASRPEVTPLLKAAPAARGSRFAARHWLVVSQLAISLTLLVATGLLVHSFWNARHGDIGLGRKNILIAWGLRVDDASDRAALEQIRALPGVRRASVAFRAPLSPSGGGLAMHVTIPGHPQFVTAAPAVIKYTSVDRDYFALMGVPLRRGRVFSDQDSEGRPRVVVISEAMGRRYFGDGNPLDRHIRAVPDGADYRIVGVVADAPINQIGEMPEPLIYTCWWQNSMGEHAFLVETDASPLALAPAVRTVLTQAHPVLGRVDMSTLDRLVERSASEYRMAAQLAAALGLLGVVLTAIGLYGVMGYGVTLRTREIGIRMAVGAQAREAAGLIMRQAFWLSLTGIAVGLPLSLGAARALQSLLFGISPWNPTPVLMGAAALVMVSLVAAWLPARRAARVDPMQALRHE